MRRPEGLMLDEVPTPHPEGKPGVNSAREK
jgi:hypothetical protein